MVIGITTLGSCAESDRKNEVDAVFAVFASFFFRS